MEQHEIMNTEFAKPTEDYLRVATASPEIAIADIPENVRAIALKYQEARREEAELLALPELCVTGYSAADLFHNTHVLEQAAKGVQELAELTKDGPAMIVGAPLVHEGLLYNCAVMLAEGRVLGAVPKTHLPNYKEFYEQRWFTSGGDVRNETIKIAGSIAPFGTDLLFEVNGTTVGLEVCEDGWAAISPGTYAALGGAEVIVNLSASNELIGKAEYRRDKLVGATAGRLICAYVYASAGAGESVADVVYGGHQIISEGGHIVQEREPYSYDQSLLVQDIDRTYLAHDRLVNKTWAAQAKQMRGQNPFRKVFANVPRPVDGELLRRVEPLTHTPTDPEALEARCQTIMTYLAEGLAQRVQEKNSKALVLGLSGGLDSTLALLVALEACKIMGEPTSFIHTITMPGPASSERTQTNADFLAQAIGTTHKTVPISELTEMFLQAIGYEGDRTDITFENTQARTRTEILMNYANSVGGMVQGTGDMSEIAIGWSTYNGDHMSMYNPNTNVPKTLVRNLVDWFTMHHTTGDTQAYLRDILDTPISPELLGDGDLSQTTEDIVGPYAVLEFCDNELLRHGSRPSKIGYLAMLAFDGQYNRTELAGWVDSYLRRFTGSQWKRDVMPNGPKIGTVSHSPRGDLRMAPNTSPNWYK